MPPWARRLAALGAAPVVLATLDAHTQRVAREVGEIGCAVPFYAAAPAASDAAPAAAGSRAGRRRLAADYGRARSRLAELELTELAKYTLLHLLLGRGHHASVTFSEMDVLWLASRFKMAPTLVDDSAPNALLASLKACSSPPRPHTASWQLGSLR